MVFVLGTKGLPIPSTLAYDGPMGERRKPLSRWLLLGEVIGGIAFGFAVTAYCWGVPPTVNLGMSIPAIVASRLLFFAVIMTVLNLSLRERNPVWRVAAVFMSVFLFLILIVFSFPQY